MQYQKITAALVIAVLMTLAVVTAGCTTNSGPSPTPAPAVQTTAKTGNNTTLTSTAGFEITFPSQYKYDQNGSTPVKVYIYLDPANPVTAVNVGTQPANQSTTLDSLSDYYTNQFLNYKNVSYQQKLTNTTLSGKAARTVTFQATIPVQYNQSVTRNETVRVQEIWTLNNNTGYVVTYKAPPNDFSKYLPVAQNIVNTFRLT